MERRICGNGKMHSKDSEENIINIKHAKCLLLDINKILNPSFVMQRMKKFNTRYITNGSLIHCNKYVCRVCYVFGTIVR